MADGPRNGTLPNGSQRIMTLVEKSISDPSRPTLPDEFEAQLRAVHTKSAACYASMEDLGDRIETLSSSIEDDADIVVTDIGHEDSVVMHIDDVSNELVGQREQSEARVRNVKNTSVASLQNDPKRALTH